MSEPVDEIAVAEAARLQAETRRKRILEKANRRMDVVSGEQAMEEEEKAASEAKAARIRAARQRRYGKKSTGFKELTEESGVNNDDMVEASTDNPKAQAERDTPAEKPAETKPESEEWPADEELTADTGASSGDGSKKKYLGVARMRRNALKKKKDGADEVVDSGATPVALEGIDLNTLNTDPIKVSKLPIYMHILTILLLFLAGLDVALQNNQAVNVVPSLSVIQNGFPVIHRSLGPVAGMTETDPLVSMPEVKLPDDTQDEFEEDDEEKVPNTDPVFGVDLDDLTKGPGILKQLARGAVGVHRSILYLVYYLPLSVLQSLVGIPQALLRSPPVLCLVALVLRHGVGKAILGAGLPANPNGNEKGIDILAMAKNFVTNMLSTTFPTAVTMYDAFTHLRSDMYVVLCGVFTGLVYVNMMTKISQEGTAVVGAGGDEL